MSQSMSRLFSLNLSSYLALVVSNYCQSDPSHVAQSAICEDTHSRHTTVSNRKNGFLFSTITRRTARAIHFSASESCFQESFVVFNILCFVIVKLRQGSGKDRQEWQSRRKASKLKPLPRAYIKVGCHPPPTQS